MATIVEKLRIQPGNKLWAIHPPDNFLRDLGKLPSGVKVDEKPGAADQVHWFVKTKAQLEKEMSKVMKALKPGMVVWAYYPKGSSGIQTDLNRDKGWDCLMAESDKLSWINLISFNDTWSVFGFRAKTEADKIKDAKPKAKREIFDWVNPETKEVKLPPDVKSAFQKNKKESAYFDSLSFTCKKEYLEWIVTAKKPETRLKRVSGMMEMLGKKWKSPTNS